MTDWQKRLKGLIDLECKPMPLSKRLKDRFITVNFVTGKETPPTEEEFQEAVELLKKMEDEE